MSSLNSTCLSGGAPLVLSEKNICLHGFYCPNNSDEHPPEYCPPLPECQILRLDTGRCESQGLYEPVVCPEGYYCPPPGVEKIICPKGHFCPLGSHQPRRCEMGAPCGEGEYYRVNYIGLGLACALDIALVSMVISNRSNAYNSIKNGFRTSLKNISSIFGGSKTPVKFSEDADVKNEQPDIESIPPSTKDDNDFDVQAKEEDLKLLVDSFEKCIDGKHFGLRFDFQDLGRKLKNGKVLLSGVNGSIKRGSMWGVMGPSGAGKSTFMSVLMGKAADTTGTLFVNGLKKHMKEYKRIIGYVPQDDIILPELTVRENIMHSARIRLPSSWRKKEIIEHVDRVISCLSLTHVQYSLVGDVMNPVISGGQRKRVNIAMELAAAPMVLFCDEPTSGLDSTSALSLIKMLQTISKLGVTVVNVIHQPRTEIFNCLDNILLITKAQTIWQGTRTNMIKYLEDEGFFFNPTTNPADVTMDIISGEGHRHRKFVREHEVSYLAKKWAAEQPHVTEQAENAEESAALQRTVQKRGAPWHKQFWLCFLRAALQQFRKPQALFIELFTSSIAGLLIGLAIFSSHGHVFESIYLPPFQLLSTAMQIFLVPQIGILTSLAIGLSAAPPAVNIFSEDRLVYWRETAAGHSRSAYFCGKIASTLPRIATTSLHYTSMYAVMATPIVPFGLLYVINFMYFFVVYSISHMVSNHVAKENAPIFSLVVALIAGVVDGYGPTLAQVKEWHIEWLWRIGPGVWYIEAMWDVYLTPFNHLYDLEKASEITGYKLGWYTSDIAMLLGLGILYRLVAYAGMVSTDRDRQR